MASLITQISNPLLWATLNNALSGHPSVGHIARGTTLYKVHKLTSSDIAFEEIAYTDYMDSRSLTVSRAATYNKLDGEY